MGIIALINEALDEAANLIMYMSLNNVGVDERQKVINYTRALLDLKKMYSEYNIQELKEKYIVDD